MSTAEHEPWVLAFRTSDSVEARSLAAYLDNEEIATRIIGDYRDTAYTGLHLGSIQDKEVWVRQADLMTVQPIVDQWNREHHAGDLATSTLMSRQLKLILAGVVLFNVSLALVQSYHWAAAVIVAIEVLGAVGMFIFAIQRLKAKRDSWAKTPRPMSERAL